MTSKIQANLGNIHPTLATQKVDLALKTKNKCHID